MQLPALSEPIAVIGIGCHYPGSPSPLKLWENILSRRRQFRRIPNCRLPLSEYYDPDKQAPDKTYGKMAAVNDGFVFDWAARRIPKNTYLATDMAHWLAFETALQAVTDAGFTRSDFPEERTGVIVGNSLTGEDTRSKSLRLRWPYVRKVFLAAERDCGVSTEEIGRVEQVLERYYKAAFPAASEDTLSGGLSNTIAGRICNYLNCDGGGYTVDGACSSSLIAVATAAAGLSAGDLDLALAGGVDVSLDPFELIGFSKTRALTDGEMNVYDRNGNGFIPGEGCGFVVLKRYTDAVRDDNDVYAVLNGWGISSDGANAAVTAPSVPGQALALQRAYEKAGYGIEAVNFIEGHGTGTAVGDRIELEAIAALITQEKKRWKTTGPFIGITSLKSIVGHTKAAAGIGGFIKAVMAISRRICPPTAGCRHPNPMFNKAARCIYPVSRGETFPGNEKMRAGVSAMGFGGINCHVTIASAGPPSDRLAPEIDEQALMASAQDDELFVLGGGHPEVLIEKCRKLAAHADGISYGELTDLAAETSQSADSRQDLRAALIAGNPEDLADGLQRLIAVLDTRDLKPGEVHHEPSAKIWIGNRVHRTRLGFLFPGQGSQMLHMAATLAARFSWARQLVQTADSLSAEFGAASLSGIIYPPSVQTTEPEQIRTWFRQLSQTANAQPAIGLASVLWCRFLRELGIVPAAVGGHSLGEVTAFHAAGAFDDKTFLRCAFLRGQAMGTAGRHSGAMASFQCSRQQIETLIDGVTDGYVVLANINAPRQMVASGEIPAVDRLIRLASAAGVTVRKLPVSNAFHCRLASPAGKQLAEVTPLPDALSSLNTRLFSSINGQEITLGHDIKQHFVAQVTARVDFMALVRSIARCTDILIEVGPGRVLSGLVGSSGLDTGPVCLPVESTSFSTRDLNTLLATLYVNGVSVNWEALYANRLVRPFVAPEKRSFFVSPCEKTPASDTVVQAEAPVTAVSAMASVINRFADLPGETIQHYLNKRGSFIEEVIKADLKHWPVAETAERNLDPAADTCVPAIVFKKDTEADRAALTCLYDLVAEATGFPKETLTPEARFLDDLNLDSIKSGDLIAGYAGELGLSGILDPALLTNASLGEVVDTAGRLLANREATVPETTEWTLDRIREVLVDHTSRITGLPAGEIPVGALLGPDLKLDADRLHRLLMDASRVLGLDPLLDLQPLLRRSLDQIAEIFLRIVRKTRSAGGSSAVALPKSWVREFKIDLVETERPALPDWFGKRTEDRWTDARVLIIVDDPKGRVCRALGRQLASMGAGVEVYTFDEIKTGDLAENLDGFTHFIAVLPESRHEADFSEIRLRETVHRLSVAAAPPPAGNGPRRRICLAFVQFAGGSFGTDSRPAAGSPFCVCGLAKSVHLERNDLKTRVVDFDPCLKAGSIAEKTIAELEGPENFLQVGYDSGSRRRTVLISPMDPVQYTSDSAAWSETDVIVATGGAKGITAPCALAVARDTGARMALIGRTSFHGSDDRDQEAAKVRLMLKRYDEQGLYARYYACDVCDRNAVETTVARIRKDMGEITGVIHGAGLNMPRRIYQVSGDQAIQEVSPKVLGALNLLHALRERPPKLVVGFTSIIGVTGMPGNSWYAFSNETLDLILRRFEADHPGVRTLSVAYSIWRDEGMGARMGSVDVLKQKGIDAIPTDEGVRRFLHLFHHDPGTHHVIITARLAQFDTLSMRPARFIRGARFLEKLIQYTPDVESAFAVHLSHGEDLYLKDHCYNGSYLFPTVFGLEAMAQVVAHVTGITEFSAVRIENLSLRRPITVDAEIGADIVVWAQQGERRSSDDDLTVQAGIFKPGTRNNTDCSDCFSATFKLDLSESPWIQPVNLPGEALDIRPENDLYRRTLLFQGPRFQRIDKVLRLERPNKASGETLVRTIPTDAQVGQRAFASAGNRNLLLGDPFLRDALLQSAALIIPQDTALPFGIRRWDIHRRPAVFSEQDTVYIRTVLEGMSEEEVLTRVTSFDTAGVVHENLEAYRLKILQYHPEYPAVRDLVNPDRRDTRTITAALDGLADKYRIQVPDVDVAYLPGLHDLPRDRRRELARPLLERVVLIRGARRMDQPATVNIDWEPSGKPVAWVSDEPVDVSLTHDDRYCVATAADWPLGSDIAPIEHRDGGQWIGLLGPLAKPLMDGSMADGDRDRLGTAIWAVREVLNKSDVLDTIDIRIGERTGDSILFVCSTDKGKRKVLAFRQRLTRGRERMVAVAVTDAEMCPVVHEAPAVQSPGYETLLDRPHYEIMNGGPQGQVMFVHRFPVTFMPAGQLSRSVYFTHYFFWAGLVREASAWPVLQQIADQFKTGKWGGVTNFADLKVLGEATTQDLVEARLWATGNGGPENAVLDLCYDFRKMLPGGGYERLAWLEQQTTWVRILDHGVVRVEPYPEYYAGFLNEMLPRNDAPNLPEPLPEPLADLGDTECDETLYEAPVGPKVSPVLRSQRIKTSLEDANIVGNIYFANYYAWQGRVRDRYFYGLVPECFLGTGASGELICLDCRVDHLREAMPFDTIEIRMALKTLKPCHATLHFEYFKAGPDGRSLKLGTGYQKVVWVQRQAGQKPRPQPFPAAVHKAFRKAIYTGGGVRRVVNF